MRRALLLWFIFGCDDPAATSVDADQDGVVAGRDCDDDDPSLSPRAPELCDGIDNDCDRVVDDEDVLAEGLRLYQDADKDGAGDPAVTLLRCAASEMWIEDSSDCDDARADVNPAATEVCDEVDNDCDGLVDDVDSSLVGDVVGYWDGDGDGWGTSLAPETFCVLLPAWSTVAGDCDDASAARYPGAIEICDELDNDCDQQVDGPGTEGAVHAFRDRDGDGYGDRADDTWVCREISGWVLNRDDCDDNEPLAWEDAPERCDDVDNDCDGVTDGEGAIGAVQAFRDADRDGAGDPNLFAWLCDLPPGSVANGGDCDDGDDSIGPGVPELCDGLDNDCDGTADGRDAPGARRTWPDADGDGYGDVNQQEWRCTPDASRVLNGDDCDDTRADVYYGAPELCGAGDEDCDPLTLEDGTVAWRPETGHPVDLTRLFQAGTDLAPSLVTVDEPGLLEVCPGAYVVNLMVTASVEIVGQRNADSIILRNPSGRVADIRGDGLSVTLRKLTLQDGAGDPSDLLLGQTFGGALSCQGDSSLRMVNVSVLDSHASWGGGMAFLGCRGTLDDMVLRGNTADWGGALLVRDHRVIVTASRVQDNDASQSGGAAVVWEDQRDAELIFDRSIIVDNTGLNAGGVHLYAGGTPSLSCRGQLGSTHGFGRNTGSIAGAVQSDAPGFLLTSDMCDWGSAATADENDPSDIFCPSCGLPAYNAEQDANFVCDQSGCF